MQTLPRKNSVEMDLLHMLVDADRPLSIDELNEKLLTNNAHIAISRLRLDHGFDIITHLEDGKRATYSFSRDDLRPMEWFDNSCKPFRNGRKDHRKFKDLQTTSSSNS